MFAPPLDLDWSYFSDRQVLRLEAGLEGLRGELRDLEGRLIVKRKAKPEQDQESAPVLTKDYSLPDGESKVNLTADMDSLADGQYQITLPNRSARKISDKNIECL